MGGLGLGLGLGLNAPHSESGGGAAVPGLLSGTIAGISVLAATIAITASLAGSVVGTSTASAVISGTTLLAGSVVATSAVTASLTVTSQLAGAIAASSAVAGTLTNTSGGSYSTEATAYFAAMSVQPDATRKGLIDTMINGLKTDGVWTMLDWLVLTAAHDAQAARLNVKNPAQSLTASNSPAFTTDRGYAGDGVSSYLTFTGYNPSSSGGNFVQNSASAGAWSNAHATPTTASTSQIVLGTGGVDGGPRILPFSAANQMQGRLTNNTVNVNFTTNTNSQLGFRAISRTSSASLDAYASSGTPVTVANTSAAINSSAVNLCMHGGSNYTTHRIAAAFVGGGLTSTQMAALYGRLNTFLTAIGAQ